jgi:SAM-dependent methyltransferase
MTHTATRYLEAKRTVDDRALSRRVRERLLDALPPAPKILDLGCGTGLTVPRLIRWGVDAGCYLGVDEAAGLIGFARSVRPAALRRAGVEVSEGARGFTAADLSVTFETGDAIAVLADAEGIDLVVAHAFADLVPVSELFEEIDAALAPGGLAYVPITFDGGTIFQPDHPADQSVERAYHAAIDDRPGRDVHAGRHLADVARRGQGDLLAMAASDWIVRPRNGTYPADEAHFLRRILDFVDRALRQTSVEGDSDWLATRRDQLAMGRLTYVAHGYDLLYRAGSE